MFEMNGATMMKSLRPWATPLTVATSLVTLVSGALLFFHISPGLTRISHEWIGMLMIGAVGLHLALNWRAFTAYFKRPLGAGLIAVGVVVTVVSFAISPAQSERGGSPVAMIMSRVGSAEIDTLARLAHRDTTEVISALDAAGVEAAPDDTLAAIAGGDRRSQMAVLEVILSE
ncbi:DUF4405 domain-containing protein [Maritimibacter dapengensis]|uniref:DUF4405 domain-containing protein n=1 Tax=Maritimibacter dapengensis TaxID=2836868 RepID=A0ABS6T156_9RHOB|nr:DUF4405 domain-containing protein [Maritimibacter dapengensis]MBV7378966.1 DUF4405 domain-containing protein [Maritimibacter dapengensis]